MQNVPSTYHAAFDDGVLWNAQGGAWSFSGWAFSAGEQPFEIVLEIGGTRHYLQANLSRPDVAAAHSGLADHGHCGFAGTVSVPPGMHRVRLVAIEGSATECLAENTLTVATAPLTFNIETPVGPTLEAGPCRVSGWCFHPDEEIDSLVIIGALESVPARYGLGRPDVASAVAGAPEACGFEAFVALGPGTTALKLEARLRSGVCLAATTPASFRVRRQPLHLRVAHVAAALTELARRGREWRRSRGRWPHLGEWRRLVRRAAQLLSQALEDPGKRSGLGAPPAIDRYEAWLAVNAWTPAADSRLRARLAGCADGHPLVSVIVPVYDPQFEFLVAAVNSVRAQVYEHWELCLADDRSTRPEIAEYLAGLAAADSRVRLRMRELNGNISVATNDAASLAAGDILVFLDHDDVLAPDCLAEIALAALREPNADIFYSDDDKIGADGRRHSPQFKPQWSPELLLSYMYMSHVLAVRRALFAAVGGMRIGFEGSQDYDFALRATEQARRVVHIPRMLYHWRVVKGSTAESGDAKPASFEAGRRAVAEALARRGSPAEVSRPVWAEKARIGVFVHDFSDHGPAVTIIVPTRNQLTLLRRCLESLARTTYADYRVLVVDNESDDPDTLDYLRDCGHNVLHVESPAAKFNFAHLNNVAARHAQTEFVLFLNNDTEVIEPRWLSRMVGYAHLPGVGAVGARLLFGNDTVQHAGIVHGYYDGLAGPAFRNLRHDDPGYLCYAKVARNCSAVTAACMLTARATFLAHGGFDEERFGVAYNDVDYGYRLARAGLRCVYAAGAELYHHEGRSRGFGDEPRELAAFRTAYRSVEDPYYSPHLSLDDEHFAIRPVRVETGPLPRKIRALMCAFNMNWEGAPYSQFELTRELARRGVLEPIVVCPADGPLRAAYEEAGIKVHIVAHPLADCVTAAQYEAAIASFASWIGSLGATVVYGNTLQTFYAIDAAHQLRLPSLWNPRESESWREYFRGFGPDLQRAALRCFQYPYRVIFVAHATAKAYEELDSHRNFCVIHNGIDPAVIARAKADLDRPRVRRELGIADDEVAILLLGTVCERKGQQDAIEAWAALTSDAAARARLFIVGDRPNAYSSALHKRLAQLPVARREHVRIVAETGDVAPYFGAADAFLCTSRIESYPRVVLEAMAWDLPIVTTPAFGIAEQVRRDINALLYDAGDTDALARQLERIVLDVALRAQLARRAPDVLATLNDFTDMTDAYARLFQEAALLADPMPRVPLPPR